MQRIGRWARSGAVVLAWIYCLASAYFAIVWTFAPTRLWWIALSNTFAPICFLPLLLLIPLAADICVRIDPAARRIVVDPPEGLLEANERS